MQNQFELPVSISIISSVYLKIWIYLIHLGSIPVVLLSGLPWFLKVACAPVILISLYTTRRKFILLESSSSITRLFLNDLEEWWLTSATGRTFKADLQSPALVHPMLTVLCFKSGSDQYQVVLTPDIGNSDDLRRLRVRLRFRK